MSILAFFILILVVAFVIYQAIGVVKDIKKNRQKKKESIQEKEKTE